MRPPARAPLGYAPAGLERSDLEGELHVPAWGTPSVDEAMRGQSARTVLASEDFPGGGFAWPLRHPARALGGLTPLEKEAVGGRCDVQHGDCDECEHRDFVEL